MNVQDEKKIAAMSEGGRKMGIILQELLEFTKTGTNLLDIEKLAQEKIKRAGGTPSFQTVEGYEWATCLCVNDEIVHGIPVMYDLQDGDVLTIDIGMVYKSFHTDTAWTKVVGASRADQKEEVDHFLSVGEQTLWKAIAQAKPGNHIGDISTTIEKSVTSEGYSIVKSLVGHGVGKTLHEDPQIPGFQKGAVARTPLLTAGMTIAIEIIYAHGKGSMVTDAEDGWTIRTRDGSLSAVFEHSIAVTENGPMVLTKV